MAEDITPPEGEQQGQESSEALGDAGKRALDAERKARAAAERRAREAETKLKDLDDQGKSDLERLQGRVADLTKRAEVAEATAHRYEVAADKGLSPAQARRLVGSTKEELEADADALRADLGLDKSKDEGEQEQDEAVKTGRPKEAFKLGASNEEDEQPDPRKLASEVLARRY